MKLGDLSLCLGRASSSRLALPTATAPQVRLNEGKGVGKVCLSQVFEGKPTIKFEETQCQYKIQR